MQYSIPVMTADFTLVVPDKFGFETKGYNGFPVVTDTFINTRHYYHAIAKDVPEMEEEPYSDYTANLMRMDYRLSYMPQDKPDIRLFTWDDMAKRLYAGIYDYKDKDARVIRKYLETLDISNNEDELSKIRKIEEAIKSNIVISQDVSDESFNRFDKIIEKKLTTEAGYTRFFAACLMEAGIDFEAGMTTNRFAYPFDEKFENWKLLEYYLFYFPALKMYLSPTSLFYRMPVIPAGAFGNKGIFSQYSITGGTATGIAKIRTIPTLPVDSSGSDIDAHISFTDDMTPEIEITHSFRGYSAMGIREAFVYMQKDREKEVAQQLTGLVSKPEDMTSYKVENIPFKNYYENKPLKVTAHIQSPELLEKAGNKYLLKVGDVIGRQTEMYQEKKRQLPIDLPYPHALIRKITIDIPGGYKIVNPEAIRFLVEAKDAAGKQTAGFISGYKLEGNKLVISITEFYSVIHYPVSEIVPFTNVINAAADFNKVVLVLQKN